jgi:signal transduction histidine kinase
VFSACQGILERPGATLEGLLYEVRSALRADELFLISERGADMEVMSSPAENWPRRLPKAAQAGLPRGAGATLDDDAVRTLALSLGVSSKALVGAFGRPTGDIEILLAGWTEDLPLTPLSMSFVAHALSTARVALEGRRQAVSTLVDRERTRMAYALHDGLTQTVTSAVLELEALRKAIERDPVEAMVIIDSTKTEIRRALAELRGILFDLHSTPDEEPKPEALTSEVEDVVKRWRLPARVSVEGDLNAVPARILSVAYVVIREALANAAKHSSASNVSVTLAVGESDLVVTVGDGGRGFTTREEQHARGNRHIGLDMLRRRVREVGGLLNIESQPGKGTRVRARLPMREVES